MCKYSEEQIKKAFWTTFHKVGELWFDYLGDDKSNEAATECEWKDFLENLHKENNK